MDIGGYGRGDYSRMAVLTIAQRGLRWIRL